MSDTEDEILTVILCPHCQEVIVIVVVKSTGKIRVLKGDHNNPIGKLL